MRKYLFVLIFGIFVAMQNAVAANYVGKVIRVMPAVGKVYVVLSEGNYDLPPGAVASCPWGSWQIYWVDPGTPFGRSLIAVALSAKLSGKKVYAGSDGICVSGAPYNSSAKSEGLNAMDLQD